MRVRDTVRRVAAVLLLAWAIQGSVQAEEPTSASSPDAQVNDLTVAYTLSYRAGQIDQAIKTAEDALSHAERVFGPEDERVAQVLNDLGYLYQAQHTFDRAEACHHRALVIRERVFNKDGPAVVQSLDNLAKVYQDEGRSEEAGPLYERALAIVERHLSPDDPRLSDILDYYARALRNCGKAKAAEDVEARIKARHSSSAH